MKILAIRGQDLASLAGKFEVAFDAEPLAGAGLFAIVGETGAGKTTLLDAMCAALFDKTPRLEGHSGFKVGRGDDKQRLGANDVRALVRNGAGSGWAEVDFEGKDRRRYRARWEVQRARKRLAGNWQDQRMKLVRLDDGKALGSTKSEVLAEIRRVLGLSYDEFCRSALLAQFQFARFLRATGSDRAALLERMTGTQIYGDVSVAAFRKAAWFAGERRRLAEAAGLVAVLDDDARAALVAREAAARGGIVRGRTVTAALAVAGHWRERAAVLARALADGEAEVGAADAACQASAALAAEVAAVERVAAVRGRWEARGRAHARHQQAAAGAAELVQVAAAAEDAERETARAAAAAAALAAAMAAATAVAPELTQARTLDVQRGEAAREAASAAAEARSAAGEARIASELASAAADAVATAEAAIAADEGWLSVHAGRAALARDWPRWSALFDRVITARAGRDRARAELDRLTPDVSAAESAFAAATTTLTHARAAHEQAKAIADTAEERARAAPLRPAERALTAADERARGIAAVAAVVIAARQAAADQVSLRAGRDDAERDVAGAGAGEAAARAALVRTDAALDEATTTLDRLRGAAGHAGARAELAAGDPCPVCGATEHPWAGGVVDRLVAEQSARITTLRETAAAERRGLTEAQVRARIGADRVAARVAGLAAIAARAPGLTAAWRDGLAALGELPLAGDPASDAAATWLAVAERAAATGLARAREVRDAAAALAAAATTAQSAALAAAEAVEQARTAREQRRDAAMLVVAAREAAERAVASHGEALAAARGELAPALSGAPDDLRGLDHDAAALADRLAAEVATWRARAGEVERRRAALIEQRPAAAASRARADALARGAGDRAAAAARCQAALETLTAARAPLLGGRTVATVEAALRTAADEAQARVAATGADHTAARDRRTDAQARRTAGDAHALAAHGELAAAAAALAGALVEAGLDEATATPLLARDVGWLTGARAELARLAQACTQAAAVAAERRRLVDEHAAGRAAVTAALATAAVADPGALAEPGPAWAARLVAATAAVAEAEASLATAEAVRRGDDEARARRDRLADERAALDATARPFEQLAEVIGSADGKALRNFAQSLSLDALLGAANHHLDQLAPRYQLARVTGEDLEIEVIDREMGDDVRAVTSLSGGESFLVSLALALGLSSLTAADVEVKTLFIDEGFGSLDPATLDAALSVLDALRATGRQVGIVSHVRELEERVAASVAVRSVGGGKSVVAVRSGAHPRAAGGYGPGADSLRRS